MIRHDDGDDERMWPHEVRCLFDFPVMCQTQIPSRDLSYFAQQHGEGLVGCKKKYGVLLPQ